MFRITVSENFVDRILSDLIIASGFTDSERIRSSREISPAFLVLISSRKPRISK
jgi:hypothetical protein